ncbi:MAG: hypothetical protein ABEL04_00990 [Salinibacter sp.]|uniref:hypothetical protein n=1 Tax=Salinibacter sp. TaxID=2065818 RepID=UPI0035D3ECB1
MHRFLEVFLIGVVMGPIVVAPSSGQSSYDLYGHGRASGLGYASTALVSSGANANPAAGAQHRRRLVSFYARQSFGIAALRYGSLHVSWPQEWGVFSGGASTFGNDAYRELHYSLGFARRLNIGTSRFLYAGAVGRYYHTHIEGYGSAGAFGLHLGLLVSLLPSLQFGVQATNVNGPALTDGEELPQTLAVGLRYRASSRLLVVADVFKDIAFPAAVRGGLEVRPVPVLALRAGVTTAPVRFTGGAGIRLDPVRVHIAAEQHQELGWSPSASLEVQW